MGKPKPPGGKPAGSDALQAQREERQQKAAAQIAKDERFSAALKDPRFSQGLSRKQRTVAIDSRFAGMFTDADFQTKASVDKRGRKISKQQAKGEDLRRYYRLRDQDEWQNKDGEPAAPKQPAAGKAKPAAETQPTDTKGGSAKAKTAKTTAKADTAAASKKGKEDVRALLESEDMLESESESEKGSESESEMSGSSSEEMSDMDAEAQKRWERARGIKPDEKSDESESGDSDETSSESSYDSADEPLTEDEEDEDAAYAKAVQEWGVGAMAANPLERIPTGEETSRLAVLDQDWQHLRAVDIMAGLSSFVPKGGCIKRVTVYPSDYGLQRMAEEQVKGPQGIAKSDAKQAKRLTTTANGTHANGTTNGTNGHVGQSDPDQSESGSDLSEGETDNDDSDQEKSDDGKELDMTRVRMYETSKLRYYYAIVECDTVDTAVALYKECDGMEFEHSACKMDLRYVPDEQSFESRQVRDSCTSVPADYKPPELFNASLQHTDPTLTWDGEDANRKRVLQKKMTEDEIKEADFAAFLASSSEEDEQEGYENGDEALIAGTNEQHAGMAVGRQGAKSKAEAAAALREKYRALLLGGGGTDAKDKNSKGKQHDKANGSDSEGSQGSGDGSGDGEGGVAGGGRGQGKGMWDGDGRKGEFDMEVTYVPALEGLGKKLIAAKRDAEAKKSESVWEAYLRRRKEKRKERKNKKRNQDSSDDDSSDEEPNGQAAKANDDGFFAKADNESEDPFDDPFFNDPSQGVAEDSGDEEAGPHQQTNTKQRSGKHKETPLGTDAVNKGKAQGKGKGQQSNGDATNNAELELLLMDDEEIRQAALRGRSNALASTSQDPDTARNPDRASGAAGAAPRGKKARRAAKRELAKAQAAELRDEDDAQGFKADLSDPRFKGLISDHDFALDPTDPRYKAAEGSAIVKKLKSIKKKDKKGSEPAAAAAKDTKPAATAEAAAHDELRGMVAKLKRKGAQAQEAQAAKKARK